MAEYSDVLYSSTILAWNSRVQQRASAAVRKERDTYSIKFPEFVMDVRSHYHRLLELARKLGSRFGLITELRHNSDSGGTRQRGNSVPAPWKQVSWIDC
jgi:hypothetical protein